MGTGDREIKLMIYFSLTDARIVDAPKSSGAKYYIEHPQNDSIIASCETIEEAETMIEGLNNFPEAFRRTTGHQIK